MGPKFNMERSDKKIRTVLKSGFFNNYLNKNVISQTIVKNNT